MELFTHSRSAGPASSVELEPIRPLGPRPARRSPPGRGEIVLVFAGKGGVGKSMVATNVAVALGRSTTQRVALVDLDLQFGDVALMLGMERYDQSMEVLAHEGELVDARLLDQVMVPGPAGIRALLAPPAPELAELITPLALRAILREVARAHDVVVIDGPAHLDEQTLEVIEIADQLLVITSSSMAAVKDTRIMLRLLRSLGVEMDRVSVVLNHTRARSTLTKEDIEERLRMRVRTQLPFEHRIVDDAVDRGTPFVVGEPESEIAARVAWLAGYLSPGSGGADEPPEPPRAHAFRRRFSLGRREQPA
jgi:pilus assembly protein CpaE